MPILVRTISYYTCKYKCGTKAAPEYTIFEHEKKCYCNPENKSCRICLNCSFEKGFLVCNEKNLYYKVGKRALDSDTKVYDKDNNIVWEKRELSESELNDLQMDKYNEIQAHNSTRPFPTKNCSEFKLGKKVY